MFTNILIAVDGSDLAAKAIEEGVTLARKTGARITALTVAEPFHTFTMDPAGVEDTPEEYKRHTQEQSSRTLSAVAAAAEQAGVACETVVKENEHPYQAIVDTAKSRGCDLVVMASHRRHGLDGVLHGSETLKVLNHCDIPVLVG
jgi:nucleotide-binding universal stress UspA family protein